MKKIEVKNLTKIFNKIPVIDKISFYLEDNNTLGIWVQMGQENLRQ